MTGPFFGCPKNASAQLPSRGLALVEGMIINGFHSKIVLEPDGKGGHWFRVDSGLREAAGIGAGDTVNVEVVPSKEWPEPEVPADLKQALASDPQANTLWMQITQWRAGLAALIRATHNPETRSRRIEVALKIKAGTKAMLFQPEPMHRTRGLENGVLNEPVPASK